MEEVLLSTNEKEKQEAAIKSHTTREKKIRRADLVAMTQKFGKHLIYSPCRRANSLMTGGKFANKTLEGMVLKNKNS